MPAEDVTILDANATSFSIALATVTNGTAVVKNASRVGAVVGIHITPDTYYLLDEVTVKDGNDYEYEVEIDGEYGYFTMPNSNVTVTVTFKKQYSFENGVLHLLYGDFNIINHLGFGSDVMDHPENVTKVIADEGVRITQSCSQLFKDFTNCTEMDLSKVNTAGLVTTSEMFSECTNLQKLNLTGWETRQIYLRRDPRSTRSHDLRVEAHTRRLLPRTARRRGQQQDHSRLGRRDDERPADRPQALERR